jgi:hypothetical protein
VDRRTSDGEAVLLFGVPLVLKDFDVHRFVTYDSGLLSVFAADTSIVASRSALTSFPVADAVLLETPVEFVFVHRLVRWYFARMWLVLRQHIV